MLLKNDDFLILGEDLVTELTEIFYHENMEGIEAFSGNVAALRQSTHQGDFDKLFTRQTIRERRGNAKFFFEPF